MAASHSLCVSEATRLPKIPNSDFSQLDSATQDNSAETEENEFACVFAARTASSLLWPQVCTPLKPVAAWPRYSHTSASASTLRLQSSAISAWPTRRLRLLFSVALVSLPSRRSCALSLFAYTCYHPFNRAHLPAGNPRLRSCHRSSSQANALNSSCLTRSVVRRTCVAQLLATAPRRIRPY